MKILKFNEGLKSKEISEKTIEEILDLKVKISELENKYETAFNEMQTYLTKYLIIHPELQEEDYELSEEETSVETLYYSDPQTAENYIDIIYWDELPYIDEDLKIAHFSKEDLVDFVNFVNNFEEYEASKDFNL